MVFRKENKVDAFQRQISALRQQLGTEEGEEGEEEAGRGSAIDPVPETDGRAGESDAGRDDFVRPESPGYSFTPTRYGETVPPAFAAEPSHPVPPESPRPGADPEASVVAHDAAWTGDFETTGSVHVHGRFQGSITAKRDVYVADEADLDATIAAESVTVAGLVKGTIRCDGRLEVLPTGRILGDVQSPALVIHEGARITGQFRMGPTEAAAADPATAPAAVQRRAARGG